MGVNNSWRQPVTMNDWMRDIEKRLMHEERRPAVRPAFDVVGPGISTYTKPVDDWNSQGPTVNGFFHSVGDQVINSPDDSLYWIGMVEANSIGQGIQRVWEYLTDDNDPTTPPTPTQDATNWQRTFVTNPDGTRTYTPWTVGGGGGGGGGIAGIVVQDEGATVVSAASQLDFQGAGVAASSGVGEAVITIDGAPKGAAGGDLTGTYPDPTIGAGKVTLAKMAPNSVDSSKVVDGSLTAADLAPGTIPTIPTSLPPSGPAGGDLTGTYPNPTIGAGKVTSAAIADGTITPADLAFTIPASYTGTSPALTTEVWTTVTHSLGSRARDVSFEEVSTREGRQLDWRVNATNPTTQVDIRTDYPGGRAAGYYNVSVAT